MLKVADWETLFLFVGKSSLIFVKKNFEFDRCFFRFPIIINRGGRFEGKLLHSVFVHTVQLCSQGNCELNGATSLDVHTHIHRTELRQLLLEKNKQKLIILEARLKGLSKSFVSLNKKITSERVKKILSERYSLLREDSLKQTKFCRKKTYEFNAMVTNLFPILSIFTRRY